MNILLIGSGGREHAIAWKILQSPRLVRLYMTTSNASPAALRQHYPDKSVIPAAISEHDNVALVQFAQQEKIDLVIIGSEAPLASGLSDALLVANIRVFGPTQAAAQIESSKVFAKDFMARHKIPTARYATFTEFAAARDYLRSIDYSIVIKASGLAAGKGVFLPASRAEAETILQQIMAEKSLGHAGDEIVIEERLQGEEVSLLAFTDGVTIIPMLPTRDYKRLGDNDIGPNTGGMGTYAAVTLPADLTLEHLTQTVLQPTIAGLRDEQKPFVGVLYAGLMLTAQGLRVLEFNCRFGDPETQVLMPLLETDLLEIMLACASGKLADRKIKWRSQSAVCVVLAAEGYPQNVKTGTVIDGLNNDNDINNTTVFHAGTKITQNNIVTAGGRVLGVTAWADTLNQAIKLAYQRVAKITFPGMQYRRDIAQLTQGHNMNETPEITDHYSAAGVDIAAGGRAVKLMTSAVRSTYGKEVLAGIGAFGGMFSAQALKHMQDPVLVASTDGIGTKVELAVRAKRLNTLGFDIVNHSVNDILVQNARPLFFLDYVAASKLDAEKIASIVTGMAEACRAVNCALLGGETAEMPGVYMPDAVDIAGTIVGVVERANTLPQKTLQADDVLLGVASSGPHTNGYSLIRKVFAETNIESVIPELGMPLIDALLAPHRCYLHILQVALDHPAKPIKALVHITGGGFFENIPRVLPEDIGAVINANSWRVPALFELIQKRGAISTKEMHQVFNMGIGMVIITAPEHEALLRSLIKEEMPKIGKLIAGEKRVVLQ